MNDRTPNGSRKSSRLFFLGGVLTVVAVGMMLAVLLWRHKTGLESETAARKQAVEEGVLVRVAAAIGLRMPNRWN